MIKCRHSSYRKLETVHIFQFMKYSITVIPIVCTILQTEINLSKSEIALKHDMAIEID